jgi:RHS repeat-associated protein
MSTNSIPYGGLISSSGTLAGANTMRFSSKPAIFSTTGSWGFYYYGYRFYDPGMQRWLNRDPISESGFRVRAGKVSAFNSDEEITLYSFLGNWTTGTFDASGLKRGGEPGPGDATRRCGEQSGGKYGPSWKLAGYADANACATVLQISTEAGLLPGAIALIKPVLGLDWWAGGAANVALSHAMCRTSYCVGGAGGGIE